MFLQRWNFLLKENQIKLKFQLILINIDINEGEVKVLPINESKNDPNWGLTRAIIANTIIGVTNGFTKTLELNGTGYRASVSGTKLKLELGYSHDIFLKFQMMSK